MELICPSCEARYQVPDGSIGEKGRQVSCMNCGNSWHAYPPLVLGSTQSAPPEPKGLQWQGPGAVAQTAPPPPPQPVAAAPSATGRPEPRLAGGTDDRPMAGASRSEQLAEIREMLAEVQSEDRAAAALSSAPQAAAAAALAATREPEPSPPPQASDRTAPPQPEPSPVVAQALQDELEEEEAFRARAKQLRNRPEKAKPTDVKKLQRQHDRKEAKRKRDAAAGSGAFLTGVLLVAIIAAVMIAIYILHPQIIERVPGTEQALTEYVATIDGLRVSVAETFGGIRDWITEKLEKNNA